MTHLHLVCYIAAFVMFVIAIFPIDTRLNLVAAGLASLTLTLFV